MEPLVGNKFCIGRKICGVSFGEIYLGGAAAVAKGKRRAGEEPMDKATLQKPRHMIKSLLLGPGNVNSSCTVAKISGTSALQIALCKEMVQWTRVEKRTFLRQRVEARLAVLLMENKEFSEVLTLLSNLIKEVRRLDDKLLLVDIDLLESKLHFSLRNLPKAKNALTAARTAANAIYVPPA
ncbi:hypothetical protein AHAS_Ahas07G0147800 [Arachis hypogaea]